MIRESLRVLLNQIHLQRAVESIFTEYRLRVLLNQIHLQLWVMLIYFLMMLESIVKSDSSPTKHLARRVEFLA